MEVPRLSKILNQYIHYRCQNGIFFRNMTHLVWVIVLRVRLNVEFTSMVHYILLQLVYSPFIIAKTLQQRSSLRLHLIFRCFSHTVSRTHNVK